MRLIIKGFQVLVRGMQEIARGMIKIEGYLSYSIYLRPSSYSDNTKRIQHTSQTGFNQDRQQLNKDRKKVEQDLNLWK